MKRNTLTAAVLAGLTGVAGMVSVSHAVNLNPDGLGQVLLYPYYTARGGNDTLISVVNTTTEAKAVKVRFLEALNSREVLDFNLYMSPFDVWTAAVTIDEGGGGRMVTRDRTCTVPYFVGQAADGVGIQEFLSFGYTGPNFDAGPQGIERTASGYLELIEMGSIPEGSSFYSAILHDASGTPRSGSGFGNPCDVLQSAWSAGGSGIWLNDPTAGLEGPTGGMFGGGAILNAEDGTMFAYDATAIDGFWAQGQIEHRNPGTIFPNLNSSLNTTSNVFSDGVVFTDTWGASAQAVDATIMFDKLMNEYNVNPDIGTRSEWVVTFPTKGLHTDFGFGGAGGSIPVAPFTDTWEIFSNFTLSSACETLDLNFWDREEQTETAGLIVSPRPPQAGFQLCREANVIRFAASSGVPAETEILKEVQRDSSALTYTNFQLPSGFNNGWLQFNFGVNPAGGNRAATANDGTQYLGLPAIGFWAQRFTNGSLVTEEGGTVLSNYAGSFDHKGSRRFGFSSSAL